MSENNAPERDTEVPDATPDSGELQPPSLSALEQVAALLRGDNEQTSEDSGESGDAPTPTRKGKTSPKSVKTLDDAAKLLGVEVSELYELEIGLPNKRKARLGDIKDAYADVDSFSVERMQWEERRTEDENAILRTKNELASLIAMLPKDALKPEFIKTMREKNSQVVARENARTLEVIPQWESEEVRQAELDGMREHLTRYGFPSNYLANVSDHRTMKYIRENYLREKRINDVLKKVDVKRDANKGRAPSSSNAARSAKRGEKTFPLHDQVSQIQSLLKR